MLKSTLTGRNPYLPSRKQPTSLYRKKTETELPQAQEFDGPGKSVDTALNAKPSLEGLYIVDRLLANRNDLTELLGSLWYLVKWLGIDAQTWEPARILRLNIVVRYHNKKKLPLPPNIQDNLEDMGWKARIYAT